jgi:hypothetical protein
MGETATINHDDTASMAVLTADGAGTITVPDSAYNGISYRSRDSGTTLNILSNVKPVDSDIDPQPLSGRITTINVGNAGIMAGIRAPLLLHNNPQLNSVTMDDSSDTVPMSVRFSEGPGDPRPFITVHGLAPADVIMVNGDTANINIYLGSGGTDFIVVNTPGVFFGVNVQTNIFTAGFGDNVRIFSTGPTGPVAVYLADGDSVTLGNANHQLRDIDTTNPVAIYGSGAGRDFAGRINVADVGNANTTTYAFDDFSFAVNNQTIAFFSGIGSLHLWPATGAGTSWSDFHNPANYRFVVRTDDPPP